MRILTLILLFAAVSCVKEGGGAKTENYVVVGAPVPQFEIENTIAGGWNGLKSPDDFLGKKTLLVFFITDCGDCWREMPFVQYAWEKLSGKGLKVAPVGRGETHETVKAYWDERGFTMLPYLDTGGAVFGLFANNTVPRLYLVDETGSVVWMAVEDLGYGGFTKEKGDTFNELITEILKL